MPRGSAAKEQVTNKIINAFGSNFIVIDDKKKIYVWADDGNEKVQIAISLTMPKTMIEAPNPNANDWTDEQPVLRSIELSEEDRIAIEKLKKKLDEV